MNRWCRFGYVLVLHGCGPAVWHIDGDAALIVELTVAGAIQQVQVHTGSRSELQSDGILVSFPIKEDDFVGRNGRPIDASSLLGFPIGDPPPEGCGRCRGGGEQRPWLMASGDACQLPNWLEAGDLWDDGVVNPSRPELIDAARLGAGLALDGPCDDTAPTLHGRPAQMTMCPLAPIEAPYAVDVVAITGRGDVVGSGSGSIVYIPKEGDQTTLPWDYGSPEAIAALPGGDAVLPIELEEDHTSYYHLHSQGHSLERFPVDMDRAGAAGALMDGSFLLLGRRNGAAGLRCRPQGDGLECQALSIPGAGEPDCRFLATGSGLEEILFLGNDEYLLRHRVPGGFLRYRPGSPMTCESLVVTDQPGIQEISAMLRIDRIVLASGLREVDGSIRHYLLRASLDESLHLGAFEVLREIADRANLFATDDGHFGVTFQDTFLRVDTSGRVLEELPATTPEILPGLHSGIQGVWTSTSGWQVARDPQGRIYRRQRVGQPFTKVYGADKERPSDLRAIVQSGDTCLAGAVGEWTTIEGDGSDCDSFRLRTVAEPGLKTPTLAFRWGEQAVFVTPNLTSGALDLQALDDAGLETIATIAGKSEQRLVGAAALHPDIAVLAFSTGDLVRVNRDGTTNTVHVPEPILDLGGGGGVAWIGGVGSLFRVFAVAETLHIASWQEQLGQVPSAVEAVREVTALHAPSADRGWLSVLKRTERAGELQTHSELIEIEASLHGPSLRLVQDSTNYLSSHAGGWLFAGTGERHTAIAGTKLVRGSVAIRAPIEGYSLVDCGKMMVVGGAHGHLLGIIDRPR